MKTHTHPKQAGVSLIEILVVLVILLIGIFAVVQLFPPGFLVNKQVGETTAAGRLAKEEADRYANSAANLMEGIVPVIPIQAAGGYQFQIDRNATPDDMTEADDAVYGIWAPYFSDVNKTRRIIGEQIRIPLPTTSAANPALGTITRGSVYMLSAGPFMDVQWNDASSFGAGSSVFVSGAPMIYKPLPQNTDPQNPGTLPDPRNFLANSQYTVDYGGKQIALPYYNVQGTDTAANPREFTLTISYYDTTKPGTPPVTLVDVVVKEPSDFDTWISLTDPTYVTPALPANSQLVQFSETVSRKFTQVAPATVWSGTDPYQFYLDPVRSPRIGASGGIGANMGVIVFNPLGHDWTETSPSGPLPLTAHIDYDVLDWHIIREERPMPSAPPYAVSMALKDLKKLGDFEADQTVYDDIFYGVDRTSTTAPFDTKTDFIVYNVTTGDFVPSANYTVDYKNGTVTFTDQFGSANASGTFRFLYRAHGDWALQIQKATTTFRPQIAPTPNYNEFYLGTGNAGGGSATRMYFPLSEAGKTVSIRELYYRNTGGTIVKVANESFRINANRTLFDTTLGPQPLTWIDLGPTGQSSARHPDAVSWDASSTGYAVLGVQGVSFRSRVMWRNGSTVTSTSNGNVFRTRWRKVDLDTVLTRGN